MQSKPGVLSSVVSTDQYTKSHYVKEFKQLKELTNLTYNKNQHVISYLDTKSFIATSLKLSTNIPQEDIREVIEDRAYSELGLDMATEFTVKYFEMPSISNDETREFYVFVVDPKTIHSQFDTLADKTQYINAIYPLPILMRSLYKHDIIDTGGVHCFIYFQKSDASLTIYKNGEYLYSKSLKYSFEYLHERFCELLGEKIDYNLFITKIADEGLKNADIAYQEHIMNLFGELFLYINDVITYTRRAFDIEQYNRLYIGSYIGPLLGVDEYSQTYLGMSSEDFDFNYGYETVEWYIDQIHFLLQLTYDLEATECYNCNFTIFTPPPPFLKRESGKLLTVTAASLLMALAYPIYNVGNNALASNQISDLNNKYMQIHAKRLSHERELQEKIKRKKTVKEKISKYNSELNAKKLSLKSIHDKKVNYPMKGQIIAELTSIIDALRVRISEVQYDENNGKKFSFHLYSKDEKDITRLLEYFTDKKREKYLFETQKISLNSTKTGYISKLEVTLK